MQLASKFGRNRTSVRSDTPLCDGEIARVAPSIFAEAKHDSRSERYAYIATSVILQKLRGAGFFPFMACQSKCRDESKRDFTKHMLRLRHADQINTSEANEIILINSHDGTSSYQMLAGTFRFVCANGMVCGDTLNDIRIPHKGDVADNVIEGAFRVLDDFEVIGEQIDAMKSITLSAGEQLAFGRAALALKYGPETERAPITELQVLTPKRPEDAKDDLWTLFNRAQENLVKGGLPGRSAHGQRIRTREVTGIDQNVKLNKALWMLGQEMRALKA